MAVFRSLAIPLKAVIVNLLSVAAAYGVIVAVFQWGWLGGFFGIGATGPIDPWIPLMMFTILFGLSMDYEVFLLSRIREEWRRTGDNSTAVADGLAKTARVITAAAAIMICVFGSFVFGDPLHVLKVFGLGLAAAILIDATLVRMVLVPSVMELLGPANWWMPRWLDRIVPRPRCRGRRGPGRRAGAGGCHPGLTGRGGAVPGAPSREPEASPCAPARGIVGHGEGEVVGEEADRVPPPAAPPASAGRSRVAGVRPSGDRRAEHRRSSGRGGR